MQSGESEKVNEGTCLESGSAVTVSVEAKGSSFWKWWRQARDATCLWLSGESQELTRDFSGEIIPGTFQE